MSNKFTRVLILFWLVTLFGCDASNNTDYPKLTTGQALFDHHCKSCHGKKGGGKFLYGIPSNTMTKMKPSEVKQKLLKGEGHDTEMPVFKKMPEADADKIVNYLFKLRDQVLTETLYDTN
jgi:mono/diheme cytochrome c family protein